MSADLKTGITAGLVAGLILWTLILLLAFEIL
jgi:hypothetical protein